MRIAWVEDDYANFLDGVKIFLRLVDEHYETDLIRDFDNYYDDDHSPESISILFKENTLNDLEWFESYSDIHRNINYESVKRWDAVILDLNLEKGFDAKKHKSVSPETAGFAIYLQLLNVGFPAEHIVFSTNNANQTQKLGLMCDVYDIPQPRYFEKTRSELLSEWLRIRLLDNHLTLRRGILDGCSYMIRRLQESPDQTIRINQCCCGSNSDESFLSAESLKDWLEAWPILLPSAAKSKNNEYSVFLLALLTMWDGKVGIPAKKTFESNNNLMALALRSVLKKTAEDDANEGFDVIPNILRWARNWLAHNNSLHDSTVQATAFFFLLAGRGLICNTQKPLRHEKLLLQLIGRQHHEMAFPKLSDHELITIKTDLFDVAKSTVEFGNILSRVQAYKDIKYPPRFNQMANDYVLNAPTLNFRYSPEELLMLSLLIDAKATNSGFVSELCIALKNFLPIRNKSTNCSPDSVTRIPEGFRPQQVDHPLPTAAVFPMNEEGVINAIKDAISICADDSGWALTSNVGNIVRTSYPNFKKALIALSEDYQTISSFAVAHSDIFDVSPNGTGTKYVAACMRLKQNSSKTE